MSNPAFWEQRYSEAGYAYGVEPNAFLVEAFHVDQLCYRSGGPPVGEMLYTAEMLHEDFAGGNILELTQTAAELDEGRYHHGTAAVLRLILQRPAS